MQVNEQVVSCCWRGKQNTGRVEPVLGKGPQRCTFELGPERGDVTAQGRARAEIEVESLEAGETLACAQEGGAHRQMG